TAYCIWSTCNVRVPLFPTTTTRAWAVSDAPVRVAAMARRAIRVRDMGEALRERASARDGGRAPVTLLVITRANSCKIYAVAIYQVVSERYEFRRAAGR